MQQKSFALITTQYPLHGTAEVTDAVTTTSVTAECAALQFDPHHIVSAMRTAGGCATGVYSIPNVFEKLIDESICMIADEDQVCYAIERLTGFKYTIARIDHPDADYSLVGSDELPDLSNDEFIGDTGDVQMYINNDNPDQEVYIIS